MTDKTAVRLWHPDGGEHLDEVSYETPEDGSLPTAIEHGGKTYVRNERHEGRYELVTAVKSSGKAHDADFAPAQAAEAKAAKSE